MIRFISSEAKENSKKLMKKGVIHTLSAAMVLSPMVVLVPTAAEAASLSTVVAAVPTIGDGSSANPYIITSPQELFYMNTARDKYYKLGANIDLDEYEWTPIGTFTGTLDGQGHYVQNLKINTYRPNVGLFDTIGVGGTVKNLGILNAVFAIPMSGQNTGAAGILAGNNSGRIENCHVTGQITISGVNLDWSHSLERNDGGLVGHHAGTITNSFAQVDVKLSGYAYFDYGITGGLTGINAGNISNSYFVGTLKDEVNEYADYYAPDGIAAKNSGSVLASFWDSTIGGNLNNGFGGTPKTTAEMKTQTTYTSDIDPNKNWDFNTVWGIDANINNSYPYLRNHWPTVANEVADRTISLSDGTVSIDLTSSFSDPDGNQLTIDGKSNANSVVSVVVNGRQLLLTPHSLGTATIMAIATTPQGAVVVDSFVVTVAAQTTGSVTGAVYGPNNSPLLGANVVIGGTSVVTDSQGQYTLINVPAGSQTINVSKAGYHNGTANVTVTAGQNVNASDIVLAAVQTTGSVTGAVFGPGNSPISGASVSIDSISTVTDGTGQYTLSDVPAGSQTINVSKAGYNNGTANVTVTAGQNVNASDIVLAAVQTTGSVTGQVVSSGNRISGATVSIGGISVATDALGRYTLSNVPAGKQTITVTKAGYNNETASVTVIAEQTVSAFTFFLTAVQTTGTVTGFVFGPGNSPIDGASVSIGNISAVTDSTGKYTLSNVLAGSQTVSVSSTGYNAGTATVTVTAGQSVSAGNIVLTPVQTTGTVTGAVYGPGNSPINGASVSIGGISAVTGAQGQYTLINVPAGSQTITVTRAGYNNGTANVTVTAGQSVSASDIVLSAVQTTGSVTGAVYGPGNSPISGATVSIGGSSAVTSAQGEYTLSNVLAGSQTINVSKVGYNNGTANVTVIAGQSVSASDIVLSVVQTTGTVTGAVFGTDDDPISGATVSIGGISAVTGAQGQYTLSNVPAGSQTINVSKAGYNNETANVTVTAGQSVSASVIVLSVSAVQTTGTVTGAVFGTDDDPISGATVSIGGISAVTGAQGQYTLSNVPAGSQTINVSKAGYNNETANVTVTAGQSVSASVIVLSVSAVQTTGTVTGAVYGPNNNPLLGATVAIGGISVVTDAQGQYTLGNVLAGSQTINVSKAGYNNGTANVTVTAGQSVSAGVITLSAVTSGNNNNSGGVAGPSNPTPTEPVKPVDPKPPVADVFKSSVVNNSELVSFIDSRVQQANQSSASVQLSDINGHWAEQTIRTFVKLGLIQGYNGQFKPDGDITRAELATILVKAFDIQAGTGTNATFTDINGHWGEGAILILAQAGVINGYKDSTFKPDQAISREEMVAMLLRIVNISALTKDSAKGNFADLSNSFAAAEIKEAAQAGIIDGKSKDKFDPKSDTTRAEALTIIKNVLSLNSELKKLLDSLN
ncbi:carboxypeptidase regulatory-like domain-containing protein [Cohnella sp. WQ 127256]|uniref:carboxypeptidase regulatory-like domain-containing protein n=1 Tax=Cohnella sp. WQ 127256 TaxID=2938790 RepID=UPI00211851C2|nr:carboxypeptidase regulatory-like domain-containing protein [Cohnella sp. WQ 127256]